MELAQVEQNLNLFKELISCHTNVYLWRYDGEYNLLESNCPYETVFGTVFSIFGCKEQMYDYAADHSTPLWLGTPLGLNWIAAFYKEAGELKRIYTIGPVYSTEFSVNAIWDALNKSPELNISASWKRELAAAMEKTSTVNSLIWSQYAVMLHCCVTGEKIRISDIQWGREKIMLSDGKQMRKDRHKTWLAERDLMRVIREGDLNFRDAQNRASLLSAGVPVHTSDPMRQAKTSVIVSVSLCTRAAIDGGLSPEQAYSLGDAYIQAVEDARTPRDVGAIHDTMLEDFVLRVHKLRMNPKVSRQVQTCCDYIESHTEDDLSIDLLAEMIGYSKYYLSRRFKEEMHTTINNYIKVARVERAKSLLLTSDESVLEIALRLKFCSRSHFSETFRDMIGCTPVEYREKYGKIKH